MSALCCAAVFLAALASAEAQDGPPRERGGRAAEEPQPLPVVGILRLDSHLAMQLENPHSAETRPLDYLPGVLIAPADVSQISGAQFPATPQRLPVTLYVGASEIDASRREPAMMAIGMNASGRISAATHLAVSFVQGPADIISALALVDMDHPTVRAVVTRPRWSLTAGDLVTAQHALAGPVVRGDGLTLRVNRPLFVDVILARPKYFGGGAGGHVAQARLGYRTGVGTFAILASDLTRPPRASRTISDIRVVEPQSEAEAAELDDLRRLFSRESRATGAGVETDLRFGQHTMLVRAGTLQLVSESGTGSRGAAGEARYAFNHRRARVTFYARHAPPSVLGTYLPGDALSLVTRVPIRGGFSTTAQAYSNTSWIVGQPRGVRSEGVAAGLQRGTSADGYGIQANYRELRSATFPQITRSVMLRLARRLGPLALDTRVEVGENERGQIVRPLRSYHAQVTLGGEGPLLWIRGSHEDQGFRVVRTRADIGGELALGSTRVEGGAGYGKGQLLGNLFTAWTSVEIPLPHRLSLLAGVDYVRWDYSTSRYLVFLLDEEQSPWRFTLGVRQTFALPLPFVRQAPAR